LIINGYWLGLAFVPTGSKVQRKGDSSIAVRFDPNYNESLSSSLCYRFLISLAELLLYDTAIKVERKR
jgi:hypothetical protein